jgi:hypothetical protein
MTAISQIWNRITDTTWGFRWQYRLQRWRRAWRYATNTMTTEDAGWIRHHCQDVEGFWPLEAIDAEGVLREARKNGQIIPRLSVLPTMPPNALQANGPGQATFRARLAAARLI